MWFDETDIRHAIEELAGVYEPVILQRVEEVLQQQRRKYGNLFVSENPHKPY